MCHFKDRITLWKKKKMLVIRSSLLSIIVSKPCFFLRIVKNKNFCGERLTIYKVSRLQTFPNQTILLFFRPMLQSFCSMLPVLTPVRHSCVSILLSCCNYFSVGCLLASDLWFHPHVGTSIPQFGASNLHSGATIHRSCA